MIADALPFTKSMGPKASMVTTLAAMAPDLDMLPAVIAKFPPTGLSFYGLMDRSLVNRFHRAWTHSVFITALASLPLGYLAWRWSGRRGRCWMWIVLILLAFYSHILLDLTNPWGVRAWLPFSDERPALSLLPLTDIALLVIMATVFIFNHVLRHGHSHPDGSEPPAWRRRTAELLSRLPFASRVGLVGAALAAARIGFAYVATQGLL